MLYRTSHPLFTVAVAYPPTTWDEWDGRDHGGVPSPLSTVKGRHLVEERARASWRSGVTQEMLRKRACVRIRGPCARDATREGDHVAGKMCHDANRPPEVLLRSIELMMCSDVLGRRCCIRTRRVGDRRAWGGWRGYPGTDHRWQAAMTIVLRMQE